MYRPVDSDEDVRPVLTVHGHPKDLDQTQSVSTWQGKQPSHTSSWRKDALANLLNIIDGRMPMQGHSRTAGERLGVAEPLGLLCLQLLWCLQGRSFSRGMLQPDFPSSSWWCVLPESVP